MAMLADMAAGKQVFRIHNDNPDRTACRTISIKSPPLRCGEKTHCMLYKKQGTWITCQADGEINKNIALRAGLASPNQLRHGSAKASLDCSFGLNAGLKD